jgi:hypothetical protein
MGKDITVEVHDAALPSGIGEVLGGGFDQAHAGIRDDQLDC